MPLQYRPQLFGWIGDLEKGKNYLTSPDERLIYANDNYCVFKRKILSDQIFYLCTALIAIFLACIATYLLTYLIIYFNPRTERSLLYLAIFTLLPCWLTIYILIPELYQNIFTRRGSPIIFNRKTNRVYINESYFFSFRFWYNPLLFYTPLNDVLKNMIGPIYTVLLFIIIPLVRW